MFTLLSWNVEHFKGGSERISKVTKHIKDQNPDIFGIFEVEGAQVDDLMKNAFPEYDFHITDGPQTMETIVAHRRSKFDQAAFTQKREFKAFNPSLRPGAMLTVRIASEFITLLFLHTDSGTDAPDFGNRQEMFEKISRIKKKLDDQSEGDGKLIVLGDLNTMGLFFPTRRRSDLRVDAKDEIEALGKLGEKVGMSLLSKDADATFNNGRLISDLDHVLASDSLGIVQDVEVRGWQQLSGGKRTEFIEQVSDHCSMLVRVP